MVTYYSFIHYLPEFTTKTKSLLLTDTTGKYWFSSDGENFETDEAVEGWLKKSLYKNSTPLRKHEWLQRTFRNIAFISVASKREFKSPEEALKILWPKLLEWNGKV